jgi:hypothetical protein
MAAGGGGGGPPRGRGPGEGVSQPGPRVPSPAIHNPAGGAGLRPGLWGIIAEALQAALGGTEQNQLGEE